MNISKFNEHLKAKDILQNCKLLSLAFNNYEEDGSNLKKLTILYYNNKCSEWLEFPKSFFWGFKQIYKYNNLINDRLFYTPLESNTTRYLKISGASYQIFIGKYDEFYVFVDADNLFLFFIEDRFLKSYIKELLINSNQTLFDNDFNEIKKSLESIDYGEIECFRIDILDEVHTNSND